MVVGKARIIPAFSLLDFSAKKETSEMVKPPTINDETSWMSRNLSMKLLFYFKVIFTACTTYTF